MSFLKRSAHFTRDDLRMALLVTRREVRDSTRDWRIIIPILILTLIFPALATFTAQSLFNFTAQYGANLIGDRLVPFLLLVVGFFPMSFSLVIALETFVGEKERKSLEPLLSTPLTNTQLYVGKVLAAIIPPMVTSYIGIAVYLIGLTIFVKWSIPTSLLIQILLMSTIQGIIMVAAAVIVSSQANTVRVANLLASFIIVPTALLLQFEAIVLFWGNTNGLWWFILALLVTAAIFIRMGIKIFNREELLGQDIDQIRIRWIFRLLWNRFTGRLSDGGYPGLWGWYRQVLSLIPRLRVPLVGLFIAVVGALLLGLFLANNYPVPAQEKFGFSAEKIFENTSQLSLIRPYLPSVIFFQNIRAVFIISILGMFTIGISDVLSSMLPWTIIGFMIGKFGISGESPLTFLVAAILPHGLIEMPALLIAGAAALRWHAAILARPPDRTVSENWLEGAADFGRLFIGVVIPLFLAAAYIESYITPKIILFVYGS